MLIAERRTAGLDPALVYRAAGLVYLASLLYLALLRLAPRRHPLNAHVQFLGDLLLITALVYHTGGITSPFSLFYLVIIAVASTLLRRQAGFTVATTAYLLYAATLLAIYFGKLPAPEAQQQADDPIYRLTYNLVVHFVGFYAVAVLTSLLAGRASRAEQELEEKSETLADLQVVHRDVIQSIHSGLATTDLDGRITSLNRAGEEILGRQEAELVGRPAQELLGPQRWAELTRRHSGAPALLEPSRSQAEMQRHGGTVYVGFSLSPLTDAAGIQRGWNVIFQDLTHWRELEEQVRLKDRMAAVGELAAGIAHEIGNPLAAISGSVQMLSRSAAGDPQQEKLLGILLKESQRLDRTIKGFLRFARPRERSTVEFDVARLLAENFELLRNSDEVSDRHRLHLDLEPPSSHLHADPDQVSQVFWNLARNALKAMPDGGDLRVEGVRLDGVYRLSVQDTGRGMSERQRANLFHPFQSFFDTGTGIGMAIVYRIVKDHGGDLKVDSSEDHGTRITVELPAAGPPLPAPRAEEGAWA
jgi:two-component system sensor histidine kinase PilS (NtrC family)